MMSKHLENLKNFVRDRQNKELVIFGAGDRGAKVINTWFPHDDIKCVCDNNPRKWGKRVMGIQVCSLDALRETPENYVVIIAIDDYVAIDYIREQLNSMGINCVYHFSVLCRLSVVARYDWSFSYCFHELNTYKICRDAADQIAQVREMLCDEKSVAVYDACVEKLTYNISDYTDVCDYVWFDHYFSTGIFKYEDEEILVNGGAYDGADAIYLFRLLGNTLKKAYLFEPDKYNYARMCKNIKELKISEQELEERFRLYGLGLYDAAKNTGFLHSGWVGSRIIESDLLQCAHTGDVATVRLDDVVPESEKVTLMTLDVEGAEIAALNGARRIITENKPKMALSVYHRIEDLWEIPLLVKSMVPEYRFFFRHHSWELYDKILYATL